MEKRSTNGKNDNVSSGEIILIIYLSCSNGYCKNIKLILGFWKIFTPIKTRGVSGLIAMGPTFQIPCNSQKWCVSIFRKKNSLNNFLAIHSHYPTSGQYMYYVQVIFSRNCYTSFFLEFYIVGILLEKYLHSL